MRYILAHDLGTSGNKATLFSEAGQLAGSRVHSYPTSYFNAAWAEQDSADWWRAVRDTTRALVGGSGIGAGDIAAVSFSGQMMGCLCVDKNGAPLRPSIIWADQRAQKQAAALSEKIPPRDFYRITGHRNRASYGLQKLMWVRDNEPEIYENTYKALNAKDYIIFRLTGKFCTDYTDGNGNACLDISAMQWSERILEASGVDPDKFPELRPSTFIAGGMGAEAAAETGLLEGTPVVMGGGDGLCANIGAGSYKPGRPFSYVGSSAWVATTSEKPLFDEEMRTVTWAHIAPGLYSPNGTMQTAGGAYQWLKNTVCRHETYMAGQGGEGGGPYALMDEQAAMSRPGSNGVVFLPYLLGERAPRWNAGARAAFLNMSMENTRADMIRSVMEGVAMNLGIVLDVLRGQQDVSEMVVIGGGAKSAVWRQIMADVYGVAVKAPALLEEATSIGAAITGGVGAGVFRDFSVIDDFLEIAQTQEPDPAAAGDCAAAKERFEQYYRALEHVPPL
jgi:xylulokinase